MAHSARRDSGHSKEQPLRGDGAALRREEKEEPLRVNKEDAALLRTTTGDTKPKKNNLCPHGVLHSMRYPCPKCEREFGRKANRDRHHTAAHGENHMGWLCPLGCSYSSTRKWDLLRHLRTTHGKSGGGGAPLVNEPRKYASYASYHPAAEPSFVHRFTVSGDGDRGGGIGGGERRKALPGPARHDGLPGIAPRGVRRQRGVTPLRAPQQRGVSPPPQSARPLRGCLRRLS